MHPATGEPHTAPAAAPANLLAVEIRHSILLLGWSLGPMGAVAVVLLLLTTRLGAEPVTATAGSGGSGTPGAPQHVPVLLDRCVALLAPAVDRPAPSSSTPPSASAGTARRCWTASPTLRLVGLDRDPQALQLAAARLAPYGERATLVHAVYDELADVLARLGVRRVQGVLFDLGVSSLQLDEADRGFAYAQDAPLDMRMDQTPRHHRRRRASTPTPPRELARVLREYGEERFARRIADAVVRERAAEPFTGDRAAGRAGPRRRSPRPPGAPAGHPAKRTFQALRIEVNGELDGAGAGAAGRGRRARGRRPHRRAVVPLARGPAGQAGPRRRRVAARRRPTCRSSRPSTQPLLRLLTRGAETAGDAEVAANPRAASVRLRAAERLREAA